MVGTDTVFPPASASLLASSMRRLRGILAEHQISHTRFAEACGLNRAYLGRILADSRPPGELAAFKIARGIAALGLDQEVMQHAI
jgi:transcriptional regulator with XRE-family HTH domain